MGLLVMLAMFMGTALATECVFVGTGRSKVIAHLDENGAVQESSSPLAGDATFEGVAVQDDALSDSTLWVAVGYQDVEPPRVPSQDNDPVVVWSTNGVTFNASSAPLTGAVRNVWYAGVSTSTPESLFVLVGCCGPAGGPRGGYRPGEFTVAYSSDARFWTGVRAFSETGNDVVYSAQKNLWIAVGSSPVRGGFDVAYVYGSPKVASWSVVQASVLGTAHGITYSIAHDMWFVVGSPSRNGEGAKIAFTRDPTNPSSWKVVPSSVDLFETGFRIASFNGTVIAVGARGVSNSSMGVFYAPTMSDTDTPIFVPSSEKDDFFDIGRGVFYSNVKKKWFAVGRKISPALTPGVIESQNPNPSVLSWTATPNSASALSLGRSVVCIPIRVEQILSSKVALPSVTQTSATLLEGNTVGTIDRSTVLGDWSVHGNFRIGSNFSVGGVMAIVGSLTTLANASTTSGGMFVIGKDATLTIEVRGRPRSGNSFDVQVAQYAGISGSFSNLSVTSVDDEGCNNQFAVIGAPLYGPNELSVTVSLQSSACSEGLSRGAVIGIAVAAGVVGVAAAVLLVWIMVRHRQNLTLHLKQKLHKEELTPYMELK